MMDVTFVAKKIFLFIVLGAVSHASSNNLVNDLFGNYSDIQTHGRVINVAIRLEMMQIIKLEEQNQNLRTFQRIQARWNDSELTWDPSSYQGVKRILVPARKIWTPDIAIANSVNKFVNEEWKDNFLARISHDGDVLWQFGGELQTTCKIYTKYYPFDKQKCSIEFITWLHDVTMVDIVLDHDDIDTSQYTENGEWNIDGSTCTKFDPFSYEAEPEVLYPKFECTLFITRRPQFYIIAIIAPCLMLSILTLMVFWLPPDSGEKMGFGTTILLAYSVFLLVISEQLPHTATDLSLLSVYLSFVMGMCTLSVVGSTVVLYMHHRASNNTFGHKARKFCKGLAKILCIQDEFSDPVSNGQMVTLTNMDKPQQDFVQIILENNSTNIEYPREQEQDPALKCLKEIQRDVHQISTEEPKKSDWVILATILDRMLFWFTLCTLIAGTLYYYIA